uniref:Putative tail protein n=1 Tax=viral metagenome TaxID=1070528 RepID=A0A6M3KN82_9ZZZZ
MATTFKKYKNRATSTLQAAIDDDDTSLSVAEGEGSKFPSTYPFHITIDDEIMSCTSRTNDVLTVTRAQESTIAAAHAAAATVGLNLTAEGITDILTAINALEGVIEPGAFSELTIASGVITVTQTFHTVDTESDGASDDLDTINGGSTVQVVVLHPAHDDRTIVVKHNTGNIWLQGAADVTLDDIRDSILLVWDGTKWCDIAAGGGGVDTSGTPVDNDIAKFTDADTIEGRSYAELKADLDLEIGTDVLAQQTIGIADNNLVEIDHASVADDDYAKFTANGLEGRSASEVVTDLQSSLSKIQDSDGQSYVAVGATADQTDFKNANVTTGKISAAGILTWAKQSRCKAYRATSNQTIPTTTFTKLQLNAESYDEQNEFDSTTNYRFTATEAGRYLVIVGCYYESPVADKIMGCYIYHNGARVTEPSFHSSSTSGLSTMTMDVLELAASDYVEAYAYHNCGGDEVVLLGAGLTFMTIHKQS